MIKEIEILRNKHKYQICIGTHQEPNKGEYLWNNKELKNHFDYFFTSYNVGFLKTDDGFYEKISNIILTQPADSDCKYFLEYLSKDSVRFSSYNN